MNRNRNSVGRGWVSHGVAFHGVQARLAVGGRERSKCFSVTTCGSLRKAEAAARAWLDKMAEGLPSRYATAFCVGAKDDAWCAGHRGTGLNR